MTQPPLLDILPHDPLPARISQGSPMWRLRISGERMEFRGRTFGVHVALGLLLVPVVFSVCGQLGAVRNLQFGLSLFPLFYAGGMAVGYLVMREAIPRMEYDRSKQRVFLPLGRELPVSDVLAVQVIEYLQSRGVHNELFAYQFNLCYRDRHKPQRMQLVECHEDEPLIRDAQLMASTLGVPLHEHYLTPEAFLAWENRENRALTKLAWLLMVPGIIVTMLFAVGGLVIARQPQWPRWNNPIWIGLLIPTSFLIVVIWVHRRMKQDRNRRFARAELAVSTLRTGQ